MTEWISNWKQRYWWHSKHVPVPNVDLWMELDELASLPKPKPNWVGTWSHADHEDNVRCDLLARKAAATQKSSWADGRPHAPLRLNLGVNYVPPKP
jgi:ribonuclease HI